MSSASTSLRFGYWVTFFILSVVTLCAVIEAVREKYLPIRPFVDCSSIDMPCPHITPYKNRGADRRLVKGHTARVYTIAPSLLPYLVNACGYIQISQSGMRHTYADFFRSVISFPRGGIAGEDVATEICFRLRHSRRRSLPLSFRSMLSQFLSATFTVSNCIG